MVKVIPAILVISPRAWWRETAEASCRSSHATTRPLGVDGVAVLVAAGRLEHADGRIILDEAQHAVVGNVRPQNVAGRGRVDRPFGPAAAGLKPLQLGVPDYEAWRNGDRGFHNRSSPSPFSVGSAVVLNRLQVSTKRE